MNSYEITITCADGTPLCGRVHAPESNANGAIVIAAALGVPRRTYDDIACYFATESYSVLTFNYRGLSRNTLDKPPRLSEWGSLDLQAAIEGAAQLPGGDELFVIGHSIGGQLIGLAPSADKLKGMVLVAASFPFWKRYPMPYRLSIGIAFGVLIPLVSAWRASFPLRMLGLGSEVLPSSLMSDWAKWILKDDYLLDEKFGFDPENYQRLTQPLLVFGFDDDKLVPKSSIEKLLGFYGSTNVDERFIDSGEYGIDGIGHMGFFRKKHRSGLWADTLRWIEALTAGDLSLADRASAPDDRPPPAKLHRS